jgi:c-di-GMP-binding flagellar brake protein YcgR
MAMDDKGFERRKETRYPVEANVTVRKKGGETIQAKAVDISSSGMRLRLGGGCPLGLDEEVTVEVQLPDGADRPFSSWGLGRVAHIDSNGAGIQLYGGQFNPISSRESEN